MTYAASIFYFSGLLLGSLTLLFILLRRDWKSIASALHGDLFEALPSLTLSHGELGGHGFKGSFRFEQRPALMPGSI